jgi:hypothetical protein
MAQAFQTNAFQGNAFEAGGAGVQTSVNTDTSTSSDVVLVALTIAAALTCTTADTNLTSWALPQSDSTTSSDTNTINVGASSTVVDTCASIDSVLVVLGLVQSDTGASADSNSTARLPTITFLSTTSDSPGATLRIDVTDTSTTSDSNTSNVLGAGYNSFNTDTGPSADSNAIRLDTTLVDTIDVHTTRLALVQSDTSGTADSNTSAITGAVSSVNIDACGSTDLTLVAVGALVTDTTTTADSPSAWHLANTTDATTSVDNVVLVISCAVNDASNTVDTVFADYVSLNISSELVERMMALASRMIAKYGRNVDLIRFTDGTVVDVNKPWRLLPNGEVLQTVKCVFTRINETNIHGETIPTGDMLCYLAALDINTDQLNLRGEIRDGTAIWKIVHIRKISPDGNDILYMAQVRR